ncbi:putative conserved hypothetical protein [Colletotrichum sublineola]|uniref:Uncharacterized protein n=1 Tax=Colletotrichum sublineola TaxID=1173701 RepID=A0A066XC53_COLSU|nr:putative conserved hypothetical protein [Colletotrichum sublineola]
MTLSARDKVETFNFMQTLPELVDKWFPQSFDFLWEPQVPPGAERIRWTCICGKRLYDDYYGLQPGAAQAIRTKLTRSNTKSPDTTSAATGDETMTGGIAGCSQWAASTNCAAGSATGRGTTGSQELPLHTTIGASPQVQLPTASEDSCFLLFCVQTGQEGKGRMLCQEAVPVSKLVNDRSLFEFLRDMYGEKRKSRSRLTLRAVSEVGNCKMHVDFSRLVANMHGHYSVCSRNVTSPCPCCPDPTKDEYRYIIDKPQEALDMGKNYVLHCFQYPECLGTLQKSIICHVPLKQKTQLRGRPDKPSPGWGFYFEEGWHWKTIWLMISILLLTSLLFPITWWFVTSNIQGAFGLGSYCVMVAALFLNYLAQASF